MGNLAAACQIKLAKKIFNVEAMSMPTSLYFGIGYGLSANGVTSEVSAGDYARIQLLPTDFITATTRILTCSKSIVFPETASSWGQVNSWAMYDAASGGTAIFCGYLSSLLSIPANSVLAIAANEIVISLSPVSAGVGLSNTFASKLLNFLVGKTNYVTETLYIGFSASMFTATSAVTNEAYDGGTGYVRKLLGPVTISASDPVNVSNASKISYVATADWTSDLLTLFVSNSPTSTLAADILFMGSFPPIRIYTGEPVNIQIGDLQFNLQ